MSPKADTMDDARRQHRLLEALMDPKVYPHPGDAVQRIETHISTVLLVGDHAYKIKKPVDLGFLDFSSLQKRRFYCDEELRLNRRLAPDIYLDVVAFTGSEAEPQFNGPGDAFEYAVHMRRFDVGQTLDHLQARGELDLALMDALASRLSDFHDTAMRVPENEEPGRPDAVLRPMLDNFDHISPMIECPDRQAQLKCLHAWTLERFAILEDLLASRRRDGFVRECHGDLHLGNIALIDGQPVPFDGIEFNPHMRWIDVISEVAFLTMDLHARGSHAHAWRFLNAWVEHSGDHFGLRLLDFYQVYRAMVRAKVSCIRMNQDGLSDEEREQLEIEGHRYLDLAERFTRPGRPALFINHGFSGSGKTTFSEAILENIGAIRIRSDIERKRLSGLSARQRGHAAPGEGLYTQDRTELTYAHLAELSRRLLQDGFIVIVDATFLQATQRRRFADLARELALPFVILDFVASHQTLRERLMARNRDGRDASDADLEVLEHQIREHAALQDDEPVIRIDTQAGLSPADLVRIRAAAAG